MSTSCADGARDEEVERRGRRAEVLHELSRRGSTTARRRGRPTGRCRSRPAAARTAARGRARRLPRRNALPDLRLTTRYSPVMRVDARDAGHGRAGACANVSIVGRVGLRVDVRHLHLRARRPRGSSKCSRIWSVATRLLMFARPDPVVGEAEIQVEERDREQRSRTRLTVTAYGTGWRITRSACRRHIPPSAGVAVLNRRNFSTRDPSTASTAGSTTIAEHGGERDDRDARVRERAQVRDREDHERRERDRDRARAERDRAARGLHRPPDRDRRRHAAARAPPGTGRRRTGCSRSRGRGRDRSRG